MQDVDADLLPAEFVAATDNGEVWQLVDVREPWEVDIARVETAVLMPMNEIHMRVQELARETPVAVLCHSGIRSARVAAWLRVLGFVQVANITGGIDAWSESVDESIPRY